MPIVDVELVQPPGEPDPSRSLASRLADAVGQACGSAPGTTWVRLRSLSAERYAENEVEDPPSPVFVQLLMHQQPVGVVARDLAADVTRAVAAVLEVDATFVHVLFAPSAAGRIAFGGVLRD